MPDILPGVVGLVLLPDAFRLHAVFHQIVVHGLRLGSGFVGALAAGDHHLDVRVLLQVIQRLVQPVLEQNGRPPGLHLAAQDDHEPGLALYVVIGTIHHRAE